MRPVDDKFEVSQEFGSLATAGVTANANGTTVQQLVAEYGNYQPFGHAGMDFATPIGTPVRAMADGTVLYAGWSDDLPGDNSWGPAGYFRRWALYKFFPGIVTVIQHNGWISVTAHQSDNNAVSVGMHVREGQVIGKTGNTSSRTTTLAPHVHVEALVDTNYPSVNGFIYGRTNPRKFFGTSVAAQSTNITQKLENIVATLNDTEKANLMAAVDKINRYLNAPAGDIPAKTVKALLEEPITRAGGRTGVTNLRSTVSYLDSNLDGLKAGK